MLKIYKFQSIAEMELHLNGAIVGAQVGSAGLAGLVGLTATFTTPAGSVTFLPSTSGDSILPFGEIKAQIEAAVAGLNVSLIHGRLVIREAVPTNGVDIGSAVAEPARAYLGFDGAADGHVVGLVYGNAYVAPAAPFLVQAYTTPDNAHVAICQE